MNRFAILLLILCPVTFVYGAKPVARHRKPVVSQGIMAKMRAAFLRGWARVRPVRDASMS